MANKAWISDISDTMWRILSQQKHTGSNVGAEDMVFL